MSRSPFFSVVIPAYNEERLLPRLLDSIKSQTFKDFELIVIDANSTDKTPEIIKSASKSQPIDTINTKVHNISASRNLGAVKATGKYIFFIDADNYVRHNFLEEIRKILEKDCDLIIPSLVPDSVKFVYKVAYKTVNCLVWAAKKFNMSFSTGGNMIIKKGSYEALHGFDETIFVGEDHDIVERARKKGLKIVFASNPKIIFSVRRLEKEGAAVLVKYFVSTVYIAFFGKITKKIYNYQMGGDQYK